MAESAERPRRGSSQAPIGRRQVVFTHTVARGDIDSMGILYYGNYSLLFDAARKLLFREYGYPDMYAWAAEGWTMPIIRSSVQISRMARLGDVLTITAWIQAQRGVRLVMGVEVLSEDCSQRVALGFTEGCFIDAKTYRPIRPGEDWALVRGLRAEEAENAANPDPEEMEILFRPPIRETDPENAGKGKY